MKLMKGPMSKDDESPVDEFTPACALIQDTK